MKGCLASITEVDAEWGRFLGECAGQRGVTFELGADKFLLNGSSSREGSFPNQDLGVREVLLAFCFFLLGTLRPRRQPPTPAEPRWKDGRGGSVGCP